MPARRTATTAAKRTYLLVPLLFPPISRPQHDTGTAVRRMFRSRLQNDPPLSRQNINVLQLPDDVVVMTAQVTRSGDGR